MQLFAHDVNVTVYEDEEGEYSELLVLQGKDWDGNPFQVVLREEEAKMVSIQLAYHLYEKE